MVGSQLLLLIVPPCPFKVRTGFHQNRTQAAKHDFTAWLRPSLDCRKKSPGFPHTHSSPCFLLYFCTYILNLVSSATHPGHTQQSWGRVLGLHAPMYAWSLISSDLLVPLRKSDNGVILTFVLQSPSPTLPQQRWLCTFERPGSHGVGLSISGCLCCGVRRQS